MNLYKDISFYSEYFKKQADFDIIKDFVLVNNISYEHQGKSYMGTICTNKTIYPITIDVIIPDSFPHHKLSFWTNTIQGYPHLIYNQYRKSNWFCLNAPFAETAEAQLDVELDRLRSWFDKQLRSDLPPKIEDAKMIRSLRQVNAYSWENPDEILEFKEDSVLTFIGDWGHDPNSFDSNIGKLHCIKGFSNRLYAFKEEGLTDYEIPYIIVDKLPNSDIKFNFLLLKEYFKWDETVCEHLLPEINIKELSKRHISSDIFFIKDYNEEETKNIINKGKKLLVSTSISKDDKIILENKIQNFEKKLSKDNMLRHDSWLDQPVSDDYDEDDYFASKVYPYYRLQFALGVKLYNTIVWFMVFTQRVALKYNKSSYDLGFKDSTIQISNLISIPLYWENTRECKNRQYFGRGHLSSNLTNKKIALIGIGAIGSKLAETLVRGGIQDIAFWDGDIVEPGNICRSTYNLKDLGNAKCYALRDKLMSISPSCNVEAKGAWPDDPRLNFIMDYHYGDFYGNINYKSQEEVLKELTRYDLIIDCTASNELLHFLSYSLKADKDFISLCITNHAQNLVCVTNRDGNPFDLRKMILAKIEQDTKNYYVEGTGCFSPTFLANDNEISALVNLAAREINLQMLSNQILHSTIWSYDSRGVIADKYHLYELENDSSIKLSISNETLLDGEDIEDVEYNRNYENYEVLGYLLGGYSEDGKHIYISHFINSRNAEEELQELYNSSYGIIDYVGDYTYSWENLSVINQNLIDTIAMKAEDETINTNNPIVATRNLDGTISFYLFINGRLEKFMEL